MTKVGKEENDLSQSVYYKNIKAGMSSWREEAQICHNTDLKSHFLGKSQWHLQQERETEPPASLTPPFHSSARQGAYDTHIILWGAGYRKKNEHRAAPASCALSLHFINVLPGGLISTIHRSIPVLPHTLRKMDPSTINHWEHVHCAFPRYLDNLRN